MTGEYFLSITQLSEKVSASAAWIYEEVNAGTFPHPLQIGGMSRWSGLEVEAWMEVVKNQPRALRIRTSPKARQAQKKSSTVSQELSR